MRAAELFDFETGRTFGRYTIVKRLSVGGMAEVFLALARGPGEFKKFVTLKRILPHYRRQDEFVRMFLDEARISASLSHANIAQVFDLGIEDNELYFVMEFVPGEDLQHITARAGRVPLELAAMTIRDALLALHHAHTFVDPAGTRAPTVHRDVTPRNVMITYAGSVKIIDFGIAKAMGPLGSTAPVGSAGYLAPEQLQSGAVDARTDVFAAGVLLHELLTGSRLFPTMPGQLAMPEPASLVPPHEIDPAIPSALSEIAMTALALDPAKRWQSARDMARAIESATVGSLWNEEAAATYMQALFRDNVERARTVMRLAARQAHTKELLAALPSFDDGIDSDCVTTKVEVISPKHTAQPRHLIVIAVDDSSAALQLLKHHMNRQNIDVVCCTTPTEAMEAIGSTVADAIILDVMMPEVDGFELCKRIRALATAQMVPILFLSAACDLDERTKCLAAGGDDFIRKPYVPEELAARLRSHVGRAAMIGPVD